MKKLIITSGVFALVLITVIGVVVLVQMDFSNDEDLDVFIATKMKSFRGVGMTVAFLRAGEISWSSNYGYADREAGRLVTDETIFHIASLSKPVTGVAVMQLYEKGLIDLDESINSYLPVNITNPHFPDRPITVRMLLQHRSSLTDDDAVIRSLFTIESGLPDSDISLDEFARGYFLPGGEWFDGENNFSHVTPGDEYNYSNAGFGLLGLIVETVSGQPFNDYCRTFIFEPLGMHSAGWLSTDVDLDKLAVPYDDDTPLKPYSFPTYPDGALKVSMQDYAKFIGAMLNGGSYQGQRILKENTVAEMLPANPSDNIVWEDAVLDEFLIDTNGHSVQGHSGGDPGAFSLVAFNPDRERAIIFFVNGTPSLLGFRIFNAMSFIDRLAREGELY
jgi:CubicO group peptidase (beta-lactamase class C family)